MNTITKSAYEKIYEKYGDPTNIEYNLKSKKMVSATWKNINGLDGVIVTNYVKYKWHPYPAPVVVYAYKYLKVPETLIGSLKYASETIKIDEIDVPVKFSKVE